MDSMSSISMRLRDMGAENSIRGVEESGKRERLMKNMKTISISIFPVLIDN